MSVVYLAIKIVLYFIIIGLCIGMVLVGEIGSSQNPVNFVDKIVHDVAQNRALVASTSNPSKFASKIKIEVASTRVERGSSSHIDILRIMKSTKTPDLKPRSIDVDMLEALTL